MALSTCFASNWPTVSRIRAFRSHSIPICELHLYSTGDHSSSNEQPGLRTSQHQAGCALIMHCDEVVAWCSLISSTPVPNTHQKPRFSTFNNYTLLSTAKSPCQPDLFSTASLIYFSYCSQKSFHQERNWQSGMRHWSANGQHCFRRYRIVQMTPFLLNTPCLFCLFCVIFFQSNKNPHCLFKVMIKWLW